MFESPIHMLLTRKSYNSHGNQNNQETHKSHKTHDNHIITTYNM